MKRYPWLWCSIGCIVLMTFLSIVLYSKPCDIPNDWTPQRLYQELRAGGLIYDVHVKPSGDMLLKVHSDSTPWDEFPLATFGSKTGRLMIETNNLGGELPPGTEDILLLGKLVVKGHPDELRKVLEALSR